MFKANIILWTLALSLISCQTTQEKNLALVQDRIEKLRPLATWRPTWCRLETHLTQPAIARYREMFPTENDESYKENIAYTWKARKTTCEISALDRSSLTANHQVFLETALCTLLQVHWVNSPFEDLALGPNDIVAAGDRVQIRVASSDPSLGIYLEPEPLVVVETKTKSRGLLRATYGLHEGEWLPDRLEQRGAKSSVVVESIEYGGRLWSRRLIKSLWLSVGEEQTRRHTQIIFSNCQNY